MTNIKSLKDKNGDSFFPVTHINAIFDSDGERGELVQAKEIVDVIDFNLEDSIINRVNNIENDLNKTENTKYITINGIKEFNCKDGYIDNITIEGKTLVNVIDLTSFKADGSGLTFENNEFTCTGADDRLWSTVARQSNIKANVLYTLFAIGGKSFYFYGEGISYEKHSQGVYTFTSTTGNVGLKYVGSVGDKVKFLLLEGDHADKPISYFEGLKSVGQGYKVEVLTRTEITNSITISESNCTSSTYLDEYGKLQQMNDPYWCTSDYIEIKNDYMDCGIYLDPVDHWAVCYYDENKEFISSRRFLEGRRFLENPINAKYVRLPIKAGFNTLIVKFFNKQDNGLISTTLRSLPNGVRDTIEKRGNKYVKVQRCGEVTLNGNEDWTVFSGELYRLSINTGIKGTDTYSDPSAFLCDKLISRTIQSQWIDRSCNSVSFTTTLCEICSISYLNDLSGFKAWLKANPITVVYQLATPQIIELPNFNLQTYEGDTTLLLNTGVIQGECEFEVTNSIGSEIEVLKDKVSCLDDYESRYEFSNELMYLNGTYKLSWAEDPYIVRIGKICILHCIVANDAITYGIPLLKLPNFAKPKQHHRFFGRGKNDGIPTLLIMDYDINPDGLLYFYESSNGQIQQLNQLYIHAIWEVE